LSEFARDAINNEGGHFIRLPSNFQCRGSMSANKSDFKRSQNWREQSEPGLKMPDGFEKHAFTYVTDR
jgi:hypothetical protein